MTEQQQDSRALWDAVDSITTPTTRKLARRSEEAEWLDELVEDPTLTVCDIARYRAATVAYGQIPSLWSQAEWALGTGSEQTEGGGRTPLRERSPADLDLMETMLTIRESMAWQLPGRGITPKAKITDQMRQLAAYIVTNEPQHVDWWQFRFAQWARLLSNHLHALEHGPKPVRLRNAPCPLCKTRQVTVEENGEKIVQPPLLIDFQAGAIRAAQCSACGHAWFRGSELHELADMLRDVDPGEMMSA